MLLFAAHDPGSRNHIWPIYQHALSLGEAAEFVNLSSSSQLRNDDEALVFVHTLRPELLIAGCSANQAEWALVRASKRTGVTTAMIVDIGTGYKLAHVPPTDFPDRFLVTNQGCCGQLARYGANPDTVILTGSAFLESLAERKPTRRSDDIRLNYGLTSDENLVSFFCTPNAEASIKAISSLSTLLAKTALVCPVIVVRPHPRAAHKQKIRSACAKLKRVHYDGEEHTDTYDLLRASRFSLAMASTVSLESMVLGTPSAFYHIGWDFVRMDMLYRNLNRVLRIRTYDGLSEFVDGVQDKRGVTMPPDLENYRGALRRIWQVICELRGRP